MSIINKTRQKPTVKRVFVLPYTFFTRLICEKAFVGDLRPYFSEPPFIKWRKEEMPCVEEEDVWLRVSIYAMGNKEIGYSPDEFFVGEN